jgi:hypothetical protein
VTRFIAEIDSLWWRVDRGELTRDLFYTAVGEVLEQWDIEETVGEDG